MDRRQCIALAGSLALSRMAGAAESPYDAALAAYPGFNGVVLAGRGAAILYGKAVGLADPLHPAAAGIIRTPTG